MKKQTWFYLVLLTALALGAVVTMPVQAQTVIYVDTSATGANDGSSWANAYTDLQAALAMSESGTLIWVAEGTYYPTSGTDRTASFIMMNEVGLYGGFPAGGGDGTFEARDWDTHPTVLSGDIGAVGNSTDNSYHVVIADDTDESAVLDGFIITAGNADLFSAPHSSGGGMYINGGSPMVENVTFRDNYATNGGGMYVYSGNPLLKNVTFIENNAQTGAGVYSTNAGSPTLIDCHFEENNAVNRGGGMWVSGFNPSPDPPVRHSASLTNVVFSGNTAGLGGGGLYTTWSKDMILKNVTFSSNVANSGGAGAMYILTPEGLVLEDVDFIENYVGSSGSGGALYLTSSGTTLLNNVTFIGNYATGDEGEAAGVGGAMFVTGGATFELDDVIFEGNYATDGGVTGGLFIQLGTGTLNNAKFVNNHGKGGVRCGCQVGL